MNADTPDPTQPLSDVDANELILAIQNGEDIAPCWVLALARYAERKSDEVKNLQAQVREWQGKCREPSATHMKAVRSLPGRKRDGQPLPSLTIGGVTFANVETAHGGYAVRFDISSEAIIGEPVVENESTPVVLHRKSWDSMVAAVQGATSAVGRVA